MLVVITNLLNSNEAGLLCEKMRHAGYVDGRVTAGREARPVKRNQQVARTDPALADMQKLVTDRLMSNDLFRMAVRPKIILPPMFSRYESGMEYGNHVDNSIMRGVRTDVSVTIFLSDPDQYEGGQLVMDSPGGEREVKLPAGYAVTYPTTSLHRVAPVVSGERLAAVTWVRSFVRNAADRETLFDLDTARHRLFELLGKTPEMDLLAKTQSNLLRRWVED
ncbi:Fe2+-dependent dioxygenase [Pantoea sp. Bo_2]|uniref:Fe2+-dependent dioxygenase n=1 Tax=Candidatus Pantoea gossypiicola TaxID=2608008 RepID=A0AB34CLQ0_9GAMM|nr:MULTISPECIES: Fe2+-dependent dioxygenase [Pantoea]KAA5930376.1 Fe2+-dependent dioxygenase [Pantoea sp. VH_8]KAA5936005.1 Fe2+-dependent dioxygenase [Pantoea sp. VH_4]KAA5941009.1 Fe2+-dependent dioxygenase [Pantoea sp. VH_3]KAA5949101.1 Fe2+-dependent dioxygenase [Pantoea sp. VH_25]KAA5951859.1 Fe2+-dependent dioxygenase [Pantoea sp. VH_24]